MVFHRGRDANARRRRSPPHLPRASPLPSPPTMTRAERASDLLRPVDGLPPGDFRPAQTHRDPGCDQLRHEPGGTTTMVRQVVGKLDARTPLLCHHPHFKGRRTCLKAVPEHRQPVPLGEVEEHCRITARGNDPSGRGIGLEPMLFKILPPRHALHSILSTKDEACSTVGIEHGRCGRQMLELASSFLAARAIAGEGQNRGADCLEFHLAALAHRDELFPVHCAFPFLRSIY